jgi:CBS domain containing-hemolysin-like protein
MQEAGRLELVVTDADGAPVTVIQAADLIPIDAQDRARLHVRDLAERLGARFVRVPCDARANEVLESMANERVPYIVVIDPTIEALHGMIGLVTAADIQTMLTLRLIETRQARPSSGPPPTGLDSFVSKRAPRTPAHP